VKYNTTKMTIEDMNKLRVFFRKKPEGGSVVSIAKGRRSIIIADTNSKTNRANLLQAAKKLREQATKMEMLAEELRPSALVVLRRINARRV